MINSPARIKNKLNAAVHAAITFITSFLFIAAFAAVSFAGEAITIKILPCAVINSDIITLSNIANIEVSQNFECDLAGLKNIKIGEFNVSLPNKKMSAAEIKNIITQKVKLPEGAGIKITGASNCSIKRPDNSIVITKNFKQEFITKLETGMADLFKEKFSAKYSIKLDDTISVKIIGTLNDNLIKKLAATSEILLDCLSYKSGLMQVKINGENNFIIYCKVTKTGIVYKAREKISKKNAADIKNKIYKQSVNMPPEKFAEAVSPETNFNFDNFMENCELMRDMTINEILWKNSIKKKIFIRAGQRITLNVLKDKTNLSFDAVAETGGGMGETIKVFNPKTGRKYQAEIIAAGTARTL